MTWLILLQVLVAFVVTIYKDYLKPISEEFDEATWNACLYPGSSLK